eukprot:5884677-Pyramimonas_sp.AAC.1
MRGWWERRRSDLHILTWETEEWHQWINPDPAILRSAATHWNDASEEVNEEEGEEHISKPYWCDHACVDDNGVESTCAARFATSQGL